MINILTKQCFRCKKILSVEDFYANGQHKDGLHPYCKSCFKLSIKKGRQKNPEKVNQRNRKWYQIHKQSRAKQIAKWRDQNPQKVKQMHRKWVINNQEKLNKNEAKRRALIINAVMPWARLDLIAKYYELALLYTEIYGIKHHVDHIVPIKGKNVTGLHIENNLQILTAHENYIKSNKW